MAGNGGGQGVAEDPCTGPESPFYFSRFVAGTVLYGSYRTEWDIENEGKGWRSSSFAVQCGVSCTWILTDTE